MLGILIPYHSCFELLPFQLENLRQYIKTEYKVYVIDNSLTHQSPHPDVVWVVSDAQGAPSERHQNSINKGLLRAWNECSSFLLFDNDMIFCSEFRLPSMPYYLPQQRGNWKYGWLNLMFFQKHDQLRHFDFAKCPDTGERTDSGGSFGHYLRLGKLCAQINHLRNDYPLLQDYQEEYNALCKKFSVRPWWDIFSINGALIFHFRALSNWTKYPEEFQKEKKALIFSCLEKICEPVDGSRLS